MFTTLPAEPQHSPFIPALMSTPTPDSAAILILEDDSVLRVILGAALRDLGYMVVEAGTLEAADASLRRDDVRLFLCDMAIHGKEATSLLAAHRENFQQMGTYVVMVTGHTQYYRHYEVLGADFFIQKPVDMPTLIQLTQRVMATNREFKPLA